MRTFDTLDVISIVVVMCLVDNVEYSLNDAFML